MCSVQVCADFPALTSRRSSDEFEGPGVGARSDRRRSFEKGKVSHFFSFRPIPFLTPRFASPQVRTQVKACVSLRDVGKLRTLLLSEGIDGAIPHEVRGAVWLLLLGMQAEDLLAEDLNLFARAARNAVSEANSKEQIQKDVDRTRPGLQRFKQRTVRGALLRLLSLFCARRQVAYVQGFNELLAPFILLADTGGNPRIVYALFNDFVTRFAGWMLDTSESRVFDVLKRAFKYFDRLLLYHDPQLYWRLEDNMMTPDLYATSWFVTLFARNFTVECVMALWDLLLLSDNPLGLVFFGIAIVTGRSKDLLETDASRIPETLMMLTAESPAEVRKLWRLGEEMQLTNTPPSFLRLMTDRLLNRHGTPTSNSITAARSMQASVCLQTTPDDLVAGDAPFCVWDCRTLPEFRSGHLQQAQFLALDALRAWKIRGTGPMTDEAKGELAHALSLCEGRDAATHVCLIGSGIREEDDADINILAEHLSKHGVRYVSTLRGGFKVALAVAQSGSTLTSLELTEFDETAHKQARNVRLNAAALVAEKEYTTNLKQADGRPAGLRDMPTTSPVGGPESARETPGSTASTGSHEWGGAYTPSGVPNISNFLDRSADSEMGRALNRAMAGMGGQWNAGEPSPFSTSEVSPADSSTSAGPFTPGSVASPASTPGLPDLQRSSSASGIGKGAGGLGRPGAMSVESSPRLMDSGGLVSPMPGVPSAFPSSVSSSPNVARATASPRRSQKALADSPWGRAARPNWLSDESLSYPLALMPKGFTVNVVDDGVMAGLRLFPCKAKAERSSRIRGGRGAEFRRRYVGVSANYFLLMAPHGSKSHLLEVKAIRYLKDIIRIAFKRARPELVTFEVHVAGPKGTPAPNENFICLMPDGLRECVRLVKEYLAVAPENDLDLSPQVAGREAQGSGIDGETAKSEKEADGGTGTKVDGVRAGKKAPGLNLAIDSKGESEDGQESCPSSASSDSSMATPTVPANKFFSADDEQDS